MGKLIVFAAPSGSGKSTIIGSLMSREDLHLAFSVSATTRAPRGQERHGVEYFFFSPDEFRAHIAVGDFIEYEEVYQDVFYGTLRPQVDAQLAAGQNVVLDLDVHGAMRVKKLYGDHVLSVFVHPPSIDALRQRLEHRGTDSPDFIAERLERAAYELSFASKFDRIVVNDDLATAQQQAYRYLQEFLLDDPH